jgi:hypothetical protein
VQNRNDKRARGAKKLRFYLDRTVGRSSSKSAARGVQIELFEDWEQKSLSTLILESVLDDC